MEREVILDRATRVLLENPAASMHEIATSVGIGRTTLHRHFANRDDLLRALLIAAIDEFERALNGCHLDEGPVGDVLKRVVETLIPIGHRFGFLLRVPFFDNEPEMQARYVRLTDLLNVLIQRGQREGVLRADLPVRWLTDTLFVLMLGAWESIRDGYLALHDAPALVITTLFSGISAPYAQGA